MRTDLTAAFLAEMDKDENTPIQLMVIHFPDIGDVFLSDRDVVINGQLYDGIVENWGNLSTVGAENAMSSTMTMTLTLWNGGQYPFSSFFRNEDPVDVFVEVFQTYEGLDPEDIAILGEFTIQDPIEFSEASSLLDLELVTTNMRYFAQVGKLLTKTDFPYALESDLNKPIDFIIGSAGRVACLCCKKPPITDIDRSVVRNTTTIEVSDSLDEKGFPQYGTFTINGETVYYNSRSEYTFSNCQRGYNGTVATDHSTGSSVILATSVQYLVGLALPAPLSFSDVLVGGKPPLQAYTTIDDLNGATVIEFTSQPVFEVLAPAKNNRVYFDATVSGNTADRPHYAYSDDYRAEGAQLLWDAGFKKLLIANNTDEITERGVGDIVNVFLNVKHWETGNYTGKCVYVKVLFSGQWYNVGYLTVPNPNATLDLVADVDIDHPHIHETTGSDHDHYSHDPIANLNDTIQTHGADLRVSKAIAASPNRDGDYASESNPSYLNGSSTYYFTFNALSMAGNEVLKEVEFTMDYSIGSTNNRGTKLTVQLQYSRNGSSWQNSSRSAAFIENLAPGTGGTIAILYGDYSYSYNHTIRYRLKVYIAYQNVFNGEPWILDMSAGNGVFNWQSSTDKTDGSYSGNSVSQSNGSVDSNKTAVKATGDVRDLSISNRQVNVVAADSSLYTQEYNDVFDLLDAKSGITWADLQGCQIECTMLNDADDVGIYITWCDLVVEFKQPEYRPTDIVTCLAQGTLTNRPDAVIQYLLHNIAGVPLSNFGSVWRNLRYWDDTETWDDTEIWLDGGELADVPSGAYFEEAASWFAAHGYLIDGVISGDSSVKDAVQNLTWQTRSRLLWQHSEVQLTIKRLSENWINAGDIELNDVQLISYSAKRSRVDQIQNHIDLFYTLDRLSLAQGAGKYDSSVAVRDTASVTKHGEKKDDSMWLFDLVRTTAMAESVSSYYLWELGETSTYYKFNAYLNSFMLEKDDYIRLNSFRFDRLVGVPAVVRECVRSFGSGKLNRINTLNMISQVIRFKAYLVQYSDIVNVSDTLLIEFGKDVDYEDFVRATDLLTIEFARLIQENLTVSDELSIQAIYHKTMEDLVSVGSELTSHMDVLLEDNVTVVDALDSHSQICFGACGFGAPNCEIPFGSPTVLNESEFDAANVSDILEIMWGRLQEDVVGVTDQLCMSDGFGCPKLGDGMGLTPFGDKFC